MKTQKLKHKSLSTIFHENTKIFFNISSPVYEEIPIIFVKRYFKSYPRFDAINLPRKLRSNDISMETILRTRRSKREFNKKPLSIEEISKILLFSGGINFIEGSNLDTSLRYYPSAGARYPLEIYPIILNSKELIQGIYHYNVKNHSLEIIKRGNFKNLVIKFCCNQEWIKDASMIILISAIFGRTQMKYGKRGYRYVFLDAGHLAQNIYLIINSMKLSCCAIGGFLDNEFNSLIDVDGIQESVIYVLVVGGQK